MLNLKRNWVYALNVLCLGLILTWCLCKMTKKKKTSVESHYIFHHPRLLNVFFPRSLNELLYTFAVTYMTVVSLLEISVITVGNRSLSSLPYQNYVPGTTLLWWFLCSCTLDVLSWVQFRGSFLMTGRYCFPQHCDLTCDKSVLSTM